MGRAAISGEEFIHVNALYSLRFLKEHANRYIFAAGYVQDKVVLDVACGVGYGSFYLRRSARKVVAGDVSAEALSSLSRRFAPSIEFIRLDAQRLPFVDGAFEAICSFETIEHLPDNVSFLRECSRCLRPGGILVCSTPNKAVSSPGQSGTSTHFHAREFYPREFCEVIGIYFPDFELFGQEEWWGQREVSFAKLAGVLKPIISRLPGAQHAVNALTRFVLKDYRLAALPAGSLGDLYDRRFTPVPVKNTTLAPFLIAVARKQ